MTKKWLYLFDELDQASAYVGGEWDNVLALLGGKGANLAEMTRIGLPVPPGFTVTTEACNSYLAARKFPERIWEQELAALAELRRRPARSSETPRTLCLCHAARGRSFPCPG